MARNPWRINHPLANYVKTESGFNLVYGNTGKLVSWGWMIFCFIMMMRGLFLLWRVGNLERLIGVLAISIIFINWFSALVTIGDHRFRIPSMGMSLFLQGLGFMTFFAKGRKRFIGTSSPILWPGLHWKKGAQPDNLNP